MAMKSGWMILEAVFSSLSLLKDLDVDLVKFDLRFSCGQCPYQPGETSSSGALIAMVKQLGMKTL